MYSRNLLLSALLVIGAETYAKNNKTEVVFLSSSYNNSVENNSVDSSSLDSIFRDETLHEVKVVARKSGTSRLAGAVNGIAVLLRFHAAAFIEKRKRAQEPKGCHAAFPLMLMPDRTVTRTDKFTCLL